MISVIWLLFSIWFIGFVFNIEHEFIINSVLQDNMVLQREPYKATIWGKGTTGSKTTLTFEQTILETIVDGNGDWKIFLDPQPATAIPKSFKLTNNFDKKEINLNNILFGDVYICSGQSNMEFVIKTGFDAENTFDEANKIDDKIRIFTVDNNYQANPVDDIDQAMRQKWSNLSAESLGSNLTQTYRYFSAVCFYFGVNIHRETKIPIGLIATSWGGTTAESWAPYESVTKCSDLVIYGWPCDKPGVLWNGMIYPLLPYTIKGVIWYQAESNTGHPGSYSLKSGYECVFSTLINEWRKHFSTFGGTDPNFPFGFVQLAGYCDTGNHKCIPNEKDVQSMRWAQTLSYGYAPNPLLNNTFFAVATDLEDPLDPPSNLGDIHPRNKIDVGKRLAHAALGLIYKTHNKSITGPLVNGCTARDNLIEVTIRQDSIPNENVIIKDNIGFEVLNNETKWQTATVQVIQGLSIIVSSNVSHPKGIRYLWKSNPCCPDAYVDKLPFTCPMKQCGIYSSITALPMPPFKYDIADSSCYIRH